MTGETLARALGGRKVGGGWMARCPAHHDRKPSLSIRDAVDGKVLVHCHAGCSQDSVIAALRSRGLWVKNGPYPCKRSAPRAATTSLSGHDEAKRTEAALAISKATTPPEGTPVETYFASRGLHLPPTSTLRFHPGLKHPSGSVWPAMVALVTRGFDDAPLAIHRTFLARDGRGKAPVDPQQQKMMLGACRGGAVRLRLARAGDVLMVGEGIETCLSAMQATDYPAWAALSTSGLCTLNLPDDIRDVIVLADGDPAGETAARYAALRWHREERRVRIARPPQGMDFNDMLVSRAPIVGGMQ